MRKKNFYRIYRNTKGIKRPSPEKSLKSVPKKYKKKVVKEIKREKEISPISEATVRKETYTPIEG